MHSSWTKAAVISALLALAGYGGTAAAKSPKAAKPQPAPEAPDTTVHIQQLDPDMDLSEMGQPGVKVHPAERLEKPDPSELLKPTERDKRLSEAGLSEEIGRWDELDKDLLVLRARDPGGYPIDRLAKLYPTIPKAKLEQLRKGARP